MQMLTARLHSTEHPPQSALLSPAWHSLILDQIDKAVRVSFEVASLVMAAAFSLCDYHSLLGCRGIA